MVWILLFIAVLVLLLGPQLWTQYILKHFSQHRGDLAGTGGELAQHLIKRFNLEVTLEPTQSGDHYDPQTRTVRLQEHLLEGKSLTAIATAAHEVGHAIQHHNKMPLLIARTPLAKFAYYIERIAQLALLSAPVFLSFIPAASKIALIIALAGMLAATLVHLITLPVEWDASFGKALPVLTEGNYVSQDDLNKIRKILLACALTYVAQAMASLLNVWRWLRFIRR